MVPCAEGFVRMPSELFFPWGYRAVCRNAFFPAVRQFHILQSLRHRFFIIPVRHTGIIPVRIGIPHLIFNLNGEDCPFLSVICFQKFHEFHKSLFIPFQSRPAVHGQGRNRRLIRPQSQPVGLRLQLDIFRYVIRMSVFTGPEPKKNQMKTCASCLIDNSLYQLHIIPILFRFHAAPVNGSLQTVSPICFHRLYGFLYHIASCR